MVYLEWKKLSSPSITVEDKLNGSEIFGIAMSKRKVNQNSRGSENQLHGMATFLWQCPITNFSSTNLDHFIGHSCATLGENYYF